MISRTFWAGSAVAAVVVAAAAGCGTSTSVAGGSSSGSATAGTTTSSGSGSGGSNVGLSDSAVRTAYKAAVAQGTAVKVSGSITEGTESVGLDLQLNKDGSSQGTIAEGGATIPVEVVKGVTYIQFTSAFLTATGLAGQAPASIVNKWVSSNSTIGKSAAGAFASLVTYNGFLGSMGNPDDGSVLTAAGSGTANGEPAAVYSSSKEGAKLYFAASGPMYLLQMVGASPTKASGTVNLTWNHPTTVTAPPASEIYTGPGA